MLHVVSMYGRISYDNFIDEKSKVLVVNGENEDDCLSWKLGGTKIHMTYSCKYLGIMLDEIGCEKTKYERIGRVNQYMGRLGSKSRCRVNKYEVMRVVWNRMAVRIIIYGLEMMPRRINKLENWR